MITQDRPNILWISNHDSSAWNYGCYGDRYAHTPNIDRLAAEGVRYANAFTAGPICSPSRSQWEWKRTSASLVSIHSDSNGKSGTSKTEADKSGHRRRIRFWWIRGVLTKKGDWPRDAKRRRKVKRESTDMLLNGHSGGIKENFDVRFRLGAKSSYLWGFCWYGFYYDLVRQNIDGIGSIIDTCEKITCVGGNQTDISCP